MDKELDFLSEKYVLGNEDHKDKVKELMHGYEIKTDLHLD